MSQKSEVKSGNVSIDAGGGNGYFPAGAGLKWAKFYIGYTDFNVADVSGTFTIAVPDNVTFVHCVMNVTQAFDVAGYSINVGDDATSNTAISTSIAADSTGYISTASALYRNAQDIKVYASASANLDTATTGQVEISILYSSLP